jgi:DNA-directed RNA polymerase specialized sigma subunit
MKDKLDTAYKKFFKVLKKENPQAYNDFMLEEKIMKNCCIKEIPYKRDLLEYIINCQEKGGKCGKQTDIARLTERQADVFQMYYIDEYLICDIANILGCSEANIYYILQRINKKFKF